MSKREIEKEHYFAAMMALEGFTRRALQGKDKLCSRFGVVSALQNIQGQVKTYLIIFTSEKSSNFWISQIENNKYPNGHIILFFEDKSDLVTQATLKNFSIIDNPLENTSLN